MRKWLLVLLAVSVLSIPTFSFAQDFTEQLDSAGEAVYASSDAQNAQFYVVLGGIINALLSVAGVVLLLLFIYAGFLWMTAQGNSENVDKAKRILTQAVIGLVIILGSYAISQYVVTRLAEVGLTTDATEATEETFQRAVRFVLQ